jgi:hypothetical protein
MHECSLVQREGHELDDIEIHIQSSIYKNLVPSEVNDRKGMGEIIILPYRLRHYCGVQLFLGALLVEEKVRPIE